MTIICPRCAARFSVAGTTGITCPACGARLALRDDPSRRSSTPATANRRSHAQAPVIDLPIPKRAPTISLDPMPSLARLMPAQGGAASSARSTGRANERWRLKPEYLGDLPEPAAELPRAGRKGSTLRSVGASKTAPSTPAPSAVERAAPRIPVTRPEIPAGQPVRIEPPTARTAEASAVDSAAATKQELAPIRAARPGPESVPPVLRQPVDGKAPTVAAQPVGVDASRVVVPATAGSDALVAPAGQPLGVATSESPPPPSVAISTRPSATVPPPSVSVSTGPSATVPPPSVTVSTGPSATVPSPPVTTTAPPQPTPQPAPQPRVDQAAEIAASTEAAVRPEAVVAAAAEKTPAADSPKPAASPPSEVAGASSEEKEPAPAVESDEDVPLDETKPPAELAPPPSLQLGWVIALLLGLTVLLVVYILYRASVGH